MSTTPAAPTNNIDTAIQVLNLVNAAVPAALLIIGLLRDAAPGTTVEELRQRLEWQLAANMSQVDAWLAAHPEIKPA